ncbi:MAG: mucoidy inhibitor MuiA family protein [Cyanobacteria bacterium]|nr:mucoidy inhibitor MuiA family protein [Cyanobacteriota bacterium]
MTTTPVKTEIVAVTVYPTQARVTRRGTVQLSQGATTLELTDLPVTLQPQTVQAQGYSNSSVTLQTVLVIPIPALETQAAAIQKTAAIVRSLEDEFRKAKDQLVVLGLQRTFLETLADRSSRTFSLGLAQQQVALSGVTDFLTYLETQYQVVAEAIAQQERHKTDIDHQLQDARQQHQALQADLPDIHYRVCIPLQMAAADTLDIEVTYHVEKVQWHPCYDIRFGEAPDRLKLDCLANVCQQTGEDWPEVPIKLSSAAPENSPMLPQPDVWYIALPRQLPKAAANNPSGRSRSPILQDTYRMLGAVPGSEIPPERAIEHYGPALSPALAVVRFNSLSPVTIPSNSQAHRVPLAQYDFPSQFTYVALPQRSDAAYLQAHLTNPADGLPLLPGTAQLFRDGGYIGQERFDYVAPGQSFQLSLGLDESLSVQRELLNRHTTNQGPGCQVSFAYRLSLHNPLPYPLQVAVLEQIPVSRSDQVDVCLDASDPPSTLSSAGLCHWDLTLGPQTVAYIQYEYHIEHPCDIAVIGLEN